MPTRRKQYSGITLIELLTALVISMITILSIGTLLLHSRRGFLAEYARANARIGTDACAVRSLFDRAVRKSSAGDIVIGSNGQDACFAFYGSDIADYPDRYTWFYVSHNDLLAESGTRDEDGNRTALDTRTVCSGVQSCKFINNGASASMILTLSDGEKTKTVVTTAYAHN